MNTPNLQPVHALEVPTRVLPLLVPSACIAEVVTQSVLVPIPLSPAWVVGVMGWRSKPVPVISLEGLMGHGATAAGAAHTGARRRNTNKVVVFYPLPGRKPWEFFGIVAAAEPQSRVIDSSALANTADVPNNPFIASALQLSHAVVGIPDMDALAAALYP